MEFLKLIGTSFLSVITLFIIAKVGHKQLAQLDFFDYICGITIGSVAAELATELEAPWKPFTALVIYGLVSVILSLITHKLPRSRKFINGSPCILLDNGKLYRKNMKKSKIDLSEFLVMCREQGYFDLKDIQTAVMESNGQLSILPKSIKRPATPDDLKLKPEPAHINTEIIMDGQIMGENLKRIGVEKIWLQKELKKQGYKSEKEIYLGVCDEKLNTTFFKNI